MGLFEAGRWLALAWLIFSVPVSLMAGRLLARNNELYPLIRSPRPGERVASVHQLRPRRRRTVGRSLAVGATCAAVVFSAVGTAAALGGLPSPAQSATASVIEALSPFSVPRATESPEAAARTRAVQARRARSADRPVDPPSVGAAGGGLPAPAPGIAVPTAAPDQPLPSTPTVVPSVGPTPTQPSELPSAPAAAAAPTEAPATEGPTDPPSPPDTTPTQGPTDSPTPSDPGPTDQPTAAPSPSVDSPSPTTSDPGGTPTPEPTTTVLPGPLPTP